MTRLRLEKDTSGGRCCCKAQEHRRMIIKRDPRLRGDDKWDDKEVKVAIKLLSR